MRVLISCLWIMMMSSQTVADHGAAHLSDLEHCEASGESYKHTDLGYPISRVDWGFMSIDTADFVFDDTPCFSQAASTLRFIAETYPQLGRELALGFGPYTQNMLTLLGCPEQQHRRLAQRLRSQFSAHLQTNHTAQQTTETQARQYFSLLLLVTQRTNTEALGCTGVAWLNRTTP